jgi:hypothetical protein
MSLSILRKAAGLATATILTKSYGEYKDATNCVTDWLLTNSGRKQSSASVIVPMAKRIRSAGIRPPQHILEALAKAIRLREEVTRDYQSLTLRTTNLTRNERAELEDDNKRHIHFTEQLKEALVILRPVLRAANVFPAANQYDTFLGLAGTTTIPSRDAWENPFHSGEGVVSRLNSNRSTLMS